MRNRLSLIGPWMILALLAACGLPGCADRDHLRPSNPEALAGSDRGREKSSGEKDEAAEEEPQKLDGTLPKMEWSAPERDTVRTTDPRGLARSSSQSAGSTTVKREDASSGEGEENVLPRSLDKNPEQNYRSLEEVTWPDKFDHAVRDRFREHLRRRGWIDGASSPGDGGRPQRDSNGESSTQDE